jgi:hypothetical protein
LFSFVINNSQGWSRNKADLNYGKGERAGYGMVCFLFEPCPFVQRGFGINILYTILIKNKSNVMKSLRQKLLADRS